VDRIQRWLVVMVMVAGIALGCGGDSPLDSQQKSLVGTWRQTGADTSGFLRAIVAYMLRQGIPQEDVDEAAQEFSSGFETDPSFADLFTVNSDGTWTDNDGGSGTWRVSGSEGAWVLTLQDSANRLRLDMAYSVSGDILTLIINGAQFLALLESDTDLAEVIGVMRDVLSPVASETVLRLQYARQ